MFGKISEPREAAAATPTFLPPVLSLVGFLGILGGVALVVLAILRMNTPLSLWGVGVLLASIVLHAVGVYLRFRARPGAHARF